MQSWQKILASLQKPGISAKSNGLTLWMPPGPFIPKTTKQLDLAKKFVAFAVSPAGIAAISAAVAPTGTYLIKGAKYPGHLSVITVKVGSGLIIAKQGAVAYDLDVEKESKRLGLPAWGKPPA